jgi:rubrerythrin
MALVETSPHSFDCENNIRMACADELAAQNNYRDLRKQIYSNDIIAPYIKEDILRRLDEIIKEEEQHFGSLLFCLNLLDPVSMQNIDNGSKGQ